MRIAVMVQIVYFFNIHSIRLYMSLFFSTLLIVHALKLLIDVLHPRYLPQTDHPRES